MAKTTYFPPVAGTSSCDLTGKTTEEYSYHAAGAMTTRSTTLQAQMGYDNEGRMQSLTYPSGQSFTYSFDSLGRLSGMTDSLNNTWVSGVQYGVANELKNLTYTPAGGLPGFGETRQYNDLFQLKRLTVASGSTTVIDEGYNYSTSGQNNGRIDSKTDYGVFPAETTTYEYDDSNRLKWYQIGAGTVVQYSYDGFGNRLTEGSTSFGYDTLKNRLTQLGPIAGYYQYDANGNLTGVGLLASVQSLAYDAENRMVSALSSTATYREYYGYAPDNKRVYRKRGDNQAEEFTFYLGNRRLGTGLINDNGATLGITLNQEYWFGGKKLAVRDRLGSAVKTLPYGQERSGTVQNADSFATYYRDQQTGLDYADQRYYSASMGRFTSPDPYQASGGAGSPGSWNRYAYVSGDPVNRVDPAGLDEQDVNFSVTAFALSPYLSPFDRVFVENFNRNEAQLQNLRSMAEPPTNSFERVEYFAKLNSASYRNDMLKAVNSLNSDCGSQLAGKKWSNVTDQTILDRLIRKAPEINFLFMNGVEGALKITSTLAAGGGPIKASITGLTVQEIGGLATLQQAFAVAVGNATIMTVAFQGLDSREQGAALIHEALHIALNIGDVGLAQLLDITGASNWDANSASDSDAASSAIHSMLSKCLK